MQSCLWKLRRECDLAVCGWDADDQRGGGDGGLKLLRRGEDALV